MPNGDQIHFNVAIIEPSETFLNSDIGMIGRVLDKSGQTVPIRLLNPSDKNMMIQTGTTIGQLSTIADVIDGNLKP